MKPRIPNTIEEFLENQDDDFVDFSEIRLKHDDGQDRMDEDEIEQLLHVEEV